MNSYFRLPLLFVLILIVNFFIFSCTGKQVNKGKVEVIEKEFSVTKDDKYSWSLNVRGKLKNVGTVDVKKVVITAYCRSCQLVVTKNNWFVNEVEKMPLQKDSVQYISIGAEAEFDFKEITYFFGDHEPENFPQHIEFVIESMEI